MAYQRSKVNLGNRIQQQYDTKGDNGGENGKRQQYFKNTTQLKFFTFTKCDKEGKDYFNILPFTKKNGEADYVLDTWVHKNIGPNKGDYVCPKQNFGKPCPICEEFDRLRGDDWEAAKPYKAVRRSMYLVQPFKDDGTTEDEPQIFETSHFQFTDPLLTASKSCAKRGTPFVDFVDPDDGKVVSVTTKKDTFNKKDFMKPTRIDFEDREEPVADEVLEKCPNLEEFLVVKTYDQLSAALMGASDEDIAEGSEDSADEDDEVAEEKPQKASRFSRSNNSEAEEEERPRSRRLRNDDGSDMEDPYPDQPTEKEVVDEEPEPEEKKTYQRKSRFAR